MARYIDADLLKKEIFAHWYTYEEIDETIDRQPTADVVEVVRCKDCKFQKIESGWNCKRYKFCGNFDYPMGDDDFCSWGERKNNEINHK